MSAPKLLLLPILLISMHCMAQNQLLSGKNSLWLQAQPPAVSPDRNEQENLLAGYFNFNPVINFSDSKTKNRYNKLIKKTSSLFLVFQSANNEETNLVTLQNGDWKSFIGNKNIKEGDEKRDHNASSQNGIILSYLFNKNSIISKKAGTLQFDDLLTASRDGSQKLCELIYIPRVVTKSERNMIETYLSVKFGISLASGGDYINSSGTKIWDKNTNNLFAKRITGIGRDDFFGLNQKQSGNSEKDGLYIGFGNIKQTNEENKSGLGNNSFCIWGDNDKSIAINTDGNNFSAIKKMKRIWKLSAIAETGTTLPKLQFMIDNKIFNAVDQNPAAKNADILWLVTDRTGNSEFDFVNASYIPQSQNSTAEKILFDGVESIPNTQSLFTFIKAPEFFAVHDFITPICGSEFDGPVTIRFIGGKAPFEVDIKSETAAQHFTVWENSFEIPGLSSGDYTYVCTDGNKKTYSSNMTIDSFGDDNMVNLNPQWYIDNKEVIVTPTVSDQGKANHFAWFEEDSQIGNTGEMKISKAGNYKLIVTNTEGCEKAMPFVVYDKKSMVQTAFAMYPNPVTAGEPFSVSFPFTKEANVSISVFELSGRQIMHKELGVVSAFHYEDTINVSGTYMIVCNINGIPQASKLIVK